MPESTPESTHAQPLVSIGVPVYNGGAQLVQALESVLSQDYPHFEVVICDNASTDDTEATCRRFAQADPRVRYIRHRENLGVLPNYEFSLSASRGQYFTWLAHDDMFSDPRYLNTVVGYMEAHPEVAGCTTGFAVVGDPSHVTATTNLLQEIAAERPWPEARAELFRMPQTYVYLATYCLFRRELLAGLPIRPMTARGHSVASWEMPFLTGVAARGKIVSIPGVMRTYHVSGTSVGHRIHHVVAPFDLFVLGVTLRLTLVRLGWRLPVPLGERLSLLRLTLGNLLRMSPRTPYDYPQVLYTLEEEIRGFRAVAEERGALIVSLQEEIEKRAEIVRGLGESLREAAAETPLAPSAIPPARPRPRRLARRFLTDYFQPPAPWQVEAGRMLEEELRALRQVCNEQLPVIEALHAQAGRLLDEIDAPRPAPTG